MKNKFREAYTEIEEKIKSDKDLLREIDIIALLGSSADGEESIHWSDLDVLVVLKSDELGNIPINTLNKLQKISLDVSKCLDFPVSILSHTVNDFERYVSFEYLKHYSFGKCTYPYPKKLSEVINRILTNRSIDSATRKAYCAYHMRHIRFNLLRKYVSNFGRFDKEFVKLMIDKMIKVTDLFLNYSDVWPKSKDEILNLANKGGTVSTEPLSKALFFRKNWKKVGSGDLEAFVPSGINYIADVISLVLKDYEKATPEERMSK